MELCKKCDQHHPPEYICIADLADELDLIQRTRIIFINEQTINRTTI